MLPSHIGMSPENPINVDAMDTSDLPTTTKPIQVPSSIQSEGRTVSLSFTNAS